MVRSLIFDLGDVLLTYNPPSFICKYGVPEEEARIVISRLLWEKEDIWHGRDLGTTSSDEALDQYIKTYPDHEKTLRVFFEHENEWYSDNSETWKYLKRLRKAGFRIYVLTNWHKESWSSCIVKMPFIHDIDGAVVSAYEGVRKPDEDIYKILCMRYGLDPKECLFFDDKERNIKGAEKAGISGFHVTSQDALRNELDRILEPFDWI